MKNESNNKLYNLRHSLAHIMASVILEMFPKANLGVGPVIENGFYYDFLLPRSLTPEDLQKIEKRMRALIKEKLEFHREEMSLSDGKKFFQSLNQIFKVELISDLEKFGTTKAKEITAQDETLSTDLDLNVKADKISIYKTGKFVDLCRGPHVNNTSEIPSDSFKLDRIAGAYWRGSEKNPQLQRVYGLAFETKKALEEYTHLREEQERRDHRKLGKDLDLFVFSDVVGKGLPMFTPYGAIIRRELENFAIDEEIKRGYLHVNTPPLAKVDLYKISGHYPYYKDTMYPVMKIDEEELILRPMTCPHHFMFYKSKPHSYRELPMRIAEVAQQFRYEKSGELSGLTRVRMFCLADSHIICAKEQAKQEIKNVLDLIDYINTKLGLKKGIDYRYRLSLGDRNDTKKYYKDDQAWDKAEATLRSVLKEQKAPFFEAVNEAAFYGPKIDVQMKKVSGQEETAFTIQYDFVMPQRFSLTYINEGGKEAQPIVIHRSSIGCLERTMAFLIEHFSGAFPVWLAPVQVKVLTITDKQNKYAQKVFETLKEANVRAEFDDRAESVGKKIREAEMQKIPYMLIIGEKEVKAKSISIRARNQKDLGSMKLEKFLKKIKDEIESKALS